MPSTSLHWQNSTVAITLQIARQGSRHRALCFATTPRCRPLSLPRIAIPLSCHRPWIFLVSLALLLPQVATFDCQLREKIAENQTIIQYLPYVTRWDYLATMFTEAITANAPEQLGNIQVPKRASYIRVIMLELSRIASHLL